MDNYTIVQDYLGTPIQALDGVEVAHYKADSQGCVDIDVSTMPHGVYIFQSNKNVIKIVNK